MNEDWRNAFGILMCTKICDGTGTGICEGAPSACFSLGLFYFCTKHVMHILQMGYAMAHHQLALV